MSKLRELWIAAETEVGRMEEEIDALRARVVTYEKGLMAVAEFIRETSGATMNGSFGRWSEFRTGGRFEEWLSDFDDALKALRGEVEK